MRSETARLRMKTWICAGGGGAQQRLRQFLPEARHAGRAGHARWHYITALFQPWVALGVVLLVLWMMSRMALLSWADLSYVLPVTSIGYVLVALVGQVAAARDRSPAQRWAGIVLIMAGVALVGGGTRAADRSSAGHGGSRPMKWMLIAHHRGRHHGGRSAAGHGHAAARRDPRFPPGRPRARHGGCWRATASSSARWRPWRFRSSPTMGLLTIADLSFAVPATAVTYVLETVLAKYVLKEQVNWLRWAGASLVICGVALVSL